ncbi:hypothetical protein [Paenibacillus sp. PL91]|uniref:hypothetical protein n=1 Tax=Paenibacillus sp. PL91 TaxID=2729538 RepID=UPI00145FC0C6|nr:hypothetical protein [Paenibacillus sp. PL91]MBC9199806.1 hypothetical protein [Paenibacillus sp. PL91]
MKANTKRCSRCKQHLPLDNYSKSVKSKDGKNNYCKVCNIEYQQESRKRVYDLNPPLQLLKRSCQAAFRRSQPNYSRDGYDHVSCSYKNVKEFFSDLWNDNQFRDDWVAQTNIYNMSGILKDRPTLDRIDSKRGYEKSNIRMLPHWKNVTEGALKECQVFVIKDTRIDHRIDYSGIGEAKKAIAALYRIPKNALNCVDHGTIVEADNGVNLLLQTNDGQLKVGNESKYIMVMNKYKILYDLVTGVEVARTHQQVQSEVSGIEIRSSAS